MRIKKFHLHNLSSNNFTYIDVKVSNPDNPKHSIKCSFLVDTGAAGCAIPKEIAEELGLQERGSVDVGLADGRSIKASATYVLLETSGRKVYTWAIIGEGFEPILGVDVMKILKIHVDVSEKQPLIPLKRFRVNAITMNNNFNLPHKRAPNLTG